MKSPTRTVVLQSHRNTAPTPWLAACMESVQGWANQCGYEYRFEGDEFFRRVPAELLKKTAGKRVVATDLARLAWIKEVLREAETVLWLDADMLIVDPSNFSLGSNSYELGREVWVQPSQKSGRYRSYTKVHNAYLLFRRGNPFLAFYRHAAEQIVHAHSGEHMVPQLVGPKLLTALHNMMGCPVNEQAGMLSPWVLHDVLAGGGPALKQFLQHSSEVPAAANLCGSSVVGGEITDAEMLRVTELLANGFAVF